MAEMSRLMGVAPSALVCVVDGLTKKKLVKRGKDPRDRRKEPLPLEKKGAELFASSPKMDASSNLVKSLEGIPAPRRRELVVLLNELVKELTGSERLHSDAWSPEAKTASESEGTGPKSKEAKS